MMAGEGLTISGLHAGYPRRPVISNLDLGPLEAGTITAVIGPNAAGKSTLLLALAGLVRTSGSVVFGRVDLVALPLPVRANLLSFMPQSLPQGIALTVFESLLAALKAVPLSEDRRGDAHGQVIETLDRLGIGDLAMEPLDRLSGGQRQLVSLAQAIVRRPRILLLDEPTSALDLRHQEAVMEVVQRLAREGCLVVMVVHDLNLAGRWADRIVLMKSGAIHASGAPVTTITAGAIAEVYGVRATIRATGPTGVSVSVEGRI